MQRMIFFWCCLAAIMAFMTACGPKNLVVLAPDPDGAVGQITVSNAAGSVDIDRANESTVIRSRETAPGTPTQVDPARLEKLFGQVTSKQPPPPIHYRLNFESDSVQLLPESSLKIEEIISTIEQRMPTRVSVVGHTDTMGDKAYNIDLSMRRALAIRQQLVDEGIGAAIIDVSSHGEENPLVKTPDSEANAMNRRVEIVIR